jgi:hypothetical protein
MLSENQGGESTFPQVFHLWSAELFIHNEP